VTVLAKGDGLVIVTIAADEAGLIETVRLQNTSPHEWLVTFPVSRSATKTRALPSNVDHVFSGAQLTAIGLVTTDDVAGFTLVDPTRDS
jgi:hypothetical protein